MPNTEATEVTTNCNTLMVKLRIAFPNFSIIPNADASKILVDIRDKESGALLRTSFKVIIQAGRNKPFDAGDVVCMSPNQTGDEPSRNDVRFNVLREDPTVYEEQITSIFNERAEITKKTSFQEGYYKKETDTPAPAHPPAPAGEIIELRRQLEEMRVYAVAVYQAANRNPPALVTGQAGQAPPAAGQASPPAGGRGRGRGGGRGGLFGGLFGGRGQRPAQ